MRKVLTSVIGGVSMIASISCGPESPALPKTETVTGLVVDLACFTRNKANTGLDHDRGLACAIACVKWEGNPVGLVSSDGRIYQLAGGVTADNNAALLQHLTHTVTVTGEVSVRDDTLILTATGVTRVN